MVLLKIMNPTIYSDTCRQVCMLTGILTAIFYSYFTFAQAPDYSNSKYWAAWPGIQDKADLVPVDEMYDEQESAAADVFYIHTTTYYRSTGGNADIDNARLNKFTDNTDIHKKASVYNGAARIYAPRYRQASLHNFYKKKNDKSEKAYNTAYADVKAAFEYYLKNFNDGRPVIIAGHGQGSMHGMRLIKEYFDGTYIQNQLLAAYLIGYKLPYNSFNFIEVCNEALQTNCIVSFNVFGWGINPKNEDYSRAICVNPMSWKNDQDIAARSLHQGAAPKAFDSIDKNMIECKCNNGVLWVSKPKEKGYQHMGGKNYHLTDYALFYMNIRNNVAERVSSYEAPK